MQGGLLGQHLLYFKGAGLYIGNKNTYSRRRFYGNIITDKLLSAQKKLIHFQKPRAPKCFLFSCTTSTCNLLRFLFIGEILVFEIGNAACHVTEEPQSGSRCSGFTADQPRKPILIKCLFEKRKRICALKKIKINSGIAVIITILQNITHLS